ncbi:MAG: PAS domain S-box protein [Chloroflexaceae bacterium]|nr:PAS domain S-box protein [Chloroflexaceae bacterium]
MKVRFAHAGSHIPLPLLIIIPALLLSVLTVTFTGWIAHRHTRIVSLELADDLLTSRLQHTHAHLHAYLYEADLANQLTYPFVAQQLREEQALAMPLIRQHFDARLAVFPHLNEISVTVVTPDGVRAYANVRSTSLMTLTTSVTVTYSTAMTAAQLAISSPLTTTTQYRLLPNTALIQHHLAQLRAADGPQWMLRDDRPQLGLLAVYANPIWADDGQLLGSVQTNVSLQRMSAFLADIRSSPDEYLLIVAPDGRLVAASSGVYPTTTNINIHTSYDALLQPLSRGLQSGALCLPRTAPQAATATNTTPYSFVFAGQRYLGRALACYDNLEWMIIATLPEATVLPSPARSPTLLIWLLLGSLLAATASAIFAAVWVVRPLRQLDVATQQIVQGNWNYTLAPSLTTRRDTLGNLGRSFETMAQHLQQAFATVAERNTALREEVAQHQHTAQQLRQNQRMLQGIMDYAPFAIVVYDTDARFRLVNAYARSVYPHAEGELIGQPLLAALSPDGDGARYLAEMEQSIRTGTPIAGEFTILLADLPRHFTYSFFPILDEHGQAVLLGEINVDITERYHAEQALRESERRFRDTLKYVPVSIAIYTLEMLLYVNPAMCVLSDLSEAELIGTNVFVHSLATEHAAIQQHLAELENNATVSGVFHMPTSDGTCRLVEVTTSRITYEEQPAYISRVIDIIERFEAEQALRESEQRLRDILENAPLPIFIHTNRRVSFANQAAADLYGCPREELIGQDSFALAMPEEHGQITQYIEDERVKRGVKGVFHIRTRQGDIRIVESNMSLITYREQGSLVVIVVDITERVAAEQALHESEKRFRETIEHAPLPVFMHVNQRVLFCNHAALELLGYSQDELMAMSIWQLIHPDDTVKVQSLVETIRVNRSAMTEYRLQTRHYGARIVESHTTYLSYDGEPVLLTMLVDVTARRHAERALRDAYTNLQKLNQQVYQSRDALRSLLDGLTDAIIMVDQTGIVVNLNNAMADLLRQPVNTLVGRQWRDLWQAHPSLAPPYDLLQVTLKTDTPQQAQVRDAGNPNHPRIYQIATIPVTSEQDQSRRVIVIITDITEQLQLQEYLAQTEAFAANAMLAASVAHEVNTPLQTVMNALAFIPQAAPEDQARLMQAASSEIKRAGHIVRQFLDLYRKGSQEVDQVDVNAILERLLLLLGKRIKEQGVSLTYTPDDQQPLILGHADRLTQVCLNILINALDAMLKGGSLTVQTAVVRIDQGLYVEVIIGDTGAGIPATVLPHIFEPFVTSKPQGTGLGLPISYQIIQEHHGGIYVRSEVNLGSTFTIVLPLDGNQWNATTTKESLDL